MSGATTLGADITAGATTMSVASASSFPTWNNFKVKVDTEVMRVTSGAGTASWTVVRGIDGTTAATHTAGAEVMEARYYASLTQFREEMPGYTGATRDDRLIDLLIAASAEIEGATHRTFHREPLVTGTTTRVVDVYDTNRTRISLDIVSVSSVEIAESTGDTYSTAASSDWFLRPSSPDPGWPYEDLVLSDEATWLVLPRGFATARITGAFGWPAVPKDIEQAVLDIARERFRRGPGAGAPETGEERYSSLGRTIGRYRRRSYEYV